MNDFNYTSHERLGVLILAIAGLLTVVAILALVLSHMVLGVLNRKGNDSNKKSIETYANLIKYFVSLLIANSLQGIGTVMNLSWVSSGGLRQGEFCMLQGGLKNAGNVGTAVWSFVIMMHLFDLLFLRWSSPPIFCYIILCLGWGVVVTIVIIGPLAVQKPALGPYFGISGIWCWISPKYPAARVMAEYFIEYLSAGLCILLYLAVLLRVRGNLYRRPSDGRLALRFFSRGEGWKLSFSRDFIDSQMLQLAQRMIWFPIVSCILIVPVGIVRMVSFSGHVVPLWATILTASVFNLAGFFNVVLFFLTRRFFPDADMIPTLSTNRTLSTRSKASSKKGGEEAQMDVEEVEKIDAFGVTPFLLTAADHERSVVQAELERQASFRSVQD